MRAKENQLPFISKTLSKAVILRRKLRTIFMKNRSEKNKRNYRKQLNVSVKLPRKNESEAATGGVLS